MAAIAVTGATGAVGGRVAERLAAAGAALRLVVRDPGRAPAVEGAEVAGPADYADGAAVRRAVEGCATLFLVSGHEAADRADQHRRAVDAALEAGVERIVYLSFVGAAPDCTFTFGRDHWHTEEHVRASGVRHTFLRDNLYLAALPALAGVDGVIRGPAGDGRVAAVAHDDVADVAAAVLLAAGDEHDGACYDVTGPEALSLHEVAHELSEVAGRTITYVEETEEEAYASRSSYGAPAFEVEGWVSSYRAIADGDLAATSDTVERLTGREPQSLRRFLAAHPASYAHLLAPERRP